MSKSLLFILLFFTTACNHKTRKHRTRTANIVTKIIDGDTFYMNDSVGRETKIRFIGVDAPETHNNSHGLKGYYAKEAKEWLLNKIMDNPVRLEFDVQKTDKYGRTLAYVYVQDTIFINAEMVKAGCAFILTVPPNIKYADSFYQLQQEARENGVGLWQEVH